MIIGYLNRFDVCTLAGSTAGVAGRSAETTQSNPIAMTYRVSAATLTIDFDYETATAWKVFALFGTNLTTVATIRIQLSTVSSGNSDVIDTEVISAGVKEGYSQVYHVLTAPLTARYGRIIVADTSLAHIDIGRVFAGPAWLPTIGEAYGRSVSWMDDSRHDRTIGGQILSTNGARYRAMNFELPENTDVEMMANAFEIDRVKGTGGDILVMADATSYKQELSIWGPLLAGTPLTHWTTGRVRKRYRIEERL